MSLGIGSFGKPAVLAIALVAGSACAMSSPPPPSAGVACRVVDGAKLPPESGGEGALCAAIESAIAAQAPESAAQVEVRVLSSSMLAASVTTGDGRTLPEQKFASSDRALARSSFERFANAIAAEVARAAR